MSIVNVIICDRAVFAIILMYHFLKVALGWGSYHGCHGYQSTFRVLDLLLSESFNVLLDCIDMDLLIGHRLVRRIIIAYQVSVIDKEEGGLGILAEIEGVKATHRGLEFDNALLCFDLE